MDHSKWSMPNEAAGGGYRLDEVDRRIIHALMTDARNTSAPMIADEVSVSAATVRNRIEHLREHGIVEGFHAAIDFEQANASLTNLFLCNVEFGELEQIARQAATIPSVINVRALSGGGSNLHVMAVGEDTTALRLVGRALSELGAEIEDERLVQDDHFTPYAPFGPTTRGRPEPIADVTSLSGNSELLEVPVHENAPIAGLTLEEAGRQDLLAEEMLVIAIERGDSVITPHGYTEIRSNDLVTIFSPEGADESALTVFHEPDAPMTEST